MRNTSEKKGKQKALSHAFNVLWDYARREGLQAPDFNKWYVPKD